MIITFLENNGWKDMGIQKMEIIKSFSKDNWRLNFYTSTSKITIQDKLKKFDKGVTLDLKKLSIKDVEKILNNYATV